MTADPDYVMPIEERLKLARERGDAYAEMFDIAQGTALAWKHRADILLRAIAFYAKHEHWMAITSDSDCPCTNLIARMGNAGPDGWNVAELVLHEVTSAAKGDREPSR